MWNIALVMVMVMCPSSLLVAQCSNLQSPRLVLIVFTVVVHYISGDPISFPGKMYLHILYRVSHK